MTEDFNKWWNSDGIAEENSYREGSPVFWAWEGWQAAMKAEREACANLLLSTDLSGLRNDLVLQNWTANLLANYAAAIRARGQS